MADTIPTHYATEFSTNWIHRVQQTTAYLDSFVEDESFLGERKRYDRLTKQTSSKRTERKAQTPITDVANDFRWCYRQTYDLANILAEEDARNLAPLVLPQSDYVKQHAMAYNRDCDQVAINAALGSVITGELGTTVTAYDTTNQLISADGDQTAEDGEGVGLTVDKLILATEMFNKVDLTGMRERVIVVSPAAITDMLQQSKVTSADYATLRALVAGEINQFMGFTWKISNLLPLDPTYSDIRQCVAWIKGAIKRVKGGMRTSIDRLPEKSNATQIYSSWDLSAVRLHDEYVIQINVDEDSAALT
jgi:hypothetical protein